MKTLTTLAGAGLLLASGTAMAQDTPAPGPPPVPQPMQTQDIPPSGQPDPPQDANEASPIPQTAFTNAQIAAFAAAAMAMRQVRADETLDDAARRAQAEAVVAENGLDPTTYQAIGTAAQEDPALASRIQMAIDAMEEKPGE